MKFVETDIFAYEENPYEVYMIYIDYEKGLTNNSIQSSQQVLGGNRNVEVSY